MSAEEEEMQKVPDKASSLKIIEAKQIKLTMESVIKSTKKRRGRPRKPEPEIAEISTSLSNNLSIVSPNASVENSSNRSTSPQKENIENSKSVRKITNKEVDLSKDSFLSSSKCIDESLNASQQSTNAFELLMNARNRVIGVNTSGREKQDQAVLEDESATTSRLAITKRKSVLEEWAAKKGAQKRKRQEESRDEFIDYQMEKRAKRLKKMLFNGTAEAKKTDKESKSKVPSKDSSRKRKTKRLSSPKVERDESPPLIVVEVLEEKVEGRKKPNKRGRRLRKPAKPLACSDSSDNDQKPDTEFVKKLSSPIKKRDSLLGYFSKLDTPDESESKDRSPQKKSKKKISASMANGVHDYLSPSGRPKRSCAGKARYDYDLEKSPTKVDRSRRSRKAIRASTVVRRNSSSDTDSSDIIDLVANSTDLTTSKKLAPVFVRSIPKPTLDPAIAKARQDFLMSGIPDKMKAEIAKQKQNELLYEESVWYFPKISHVRQFLDDGEDFNSKQGIFKIPWRKIDNTQNFETIKEINFRNFTDCHLTCVKNGSSRDTIEGYLNELGNKRVLVKYLKGIYDQFPTYKCYNQLREKYRLFIAKDQEVGVEQVTDSIVVTKKTRSRAVSNEGDSTSDLNGSSKCVKPPPGAPNGELLFTEKYKPMTSEQVLVNLTPINQLRDFLSLWQTNNDKTKFNDASISSDNSNDSASGFATGNSIVLYGPSSSGKTNAVFALANEMNFNVLEINAGMKRTGKKILQELQEATQSHQVRSAKDSKNNLLKKSLGGLKSSSSSGKLSTFDSNDSSSSDPSLNGAMLSLILIEDADIVFDSDSGFIEAIYQLVSFSKRPVILIATNPNCPHLIKLIHQKSIEFPTQNVINVSKFLSILSLIENCPIAVDDIISLYTFNNKNLRKTLLELQLFIQSGGDYHRTIESTANGKPSTKVNEDDDVLEVFNTTYHHKELFSFYAHSGRNARYRLSNPVNWNVLWSNTGDMLKSAEKQVDESPNFKGDLVDFYKNISIAVQLTLPEDQIDRTCVNLGDDISHFLAEKAMELNLNASFENYDFTKSKEQNSTPNLTNMLAVTTLRSNRSISLDYESNLRSISRSEKLRSQADRRSSRFYHYLRNTCIGLSTFSTEIFDTASLIFS